MVAGFRTTLLTNAGSIGRSLSEREIAGLEAHYRLLQKWSRRMNLTGLRDEVKIVLRHFLEPIAVDDLLENEGRLVDLGSGNGFPAVPLKVLRPGLELVLVESSEKRSAFLWAVIRELGLRDARVETRRVRRLEDLGGLLPCRYLTARAVALGDLLRGRTLPILRADGKALFFLTSEQAKRLAERPPHGLRLTGTRTLPSGPRSLLAILEPADA